MKDVVFFVFDPSPRIDRRIVEFINEGYKVHVYGFANDINIKYVTNNIYEYHKLSNMSSGMSYIKRLNNIKLILDIIKLFDRNETLFYFFTLNVAIATLLIKNINYVYEESDMLFDRCKNKFAQKIIISVNKRIIKKSKLTVFTSEGFGEYYYGKKVPKNICIVPNRVSPDCLKLPTIEKAKFDIKHIKIGFVGNIRYQSILNVSKIVSEKFPSYEFHYYGNIDGLSDCQKQELSNQKNVIYHGLFKNPTDLPSIYASIDLVVCTYDIEGINPRYAEPNKLYESMFYETPMMVSSNSFLADKVERLGIGFSVDANNLQDIEDKIRSISAKNYNHYLNALKSIQKSETININKHLFEYIKSL